VFDIFLWCPLPAASTGLTKAVRVATVMITSFFDMLMLLLL
jgi:hypothetical protein